MDENTVNITVSILFLLAVCAVLWYFLFPMIVEPSPQDKCHNISGIYDDSGFHSQRCWVNGSEYIWDDGWKEIFCEEKAFAGIMLNESDVMTITWR